MRRGELRAILMAFALVLSGSALWGLDYTYPIKESSLGGVVKSQQGPLEGILIRARREGANFAVTVVSDAQGRYRFPRLDAGRYSVKTARADGFEPVAYDVEIRQGQEAQQEFVLSPAKFWDEQVSAVDWLANLPGPEKERRMVNNCVGCHFNTVRRFRFDKESWVKIVRLMRGQKGNMHYQRWGTPDHDQEADAGMSIDEPDWEPGNQALAEYLARVRGPVPFDWSQAKTFPRQTGPATKVIYTEYDIPYDSAEPHETAVSRDGIVFWSDWRWGRIGQLDPKTGEMKHWEIGQVEGKAKVHPGAFQIGFDKDDNPWTNIVWQGGLAKLDRKTGTITKWMFPDKGNRRSIMLGTDQKRNRIWFNTDDYYGDFSMAYYEPDMDRLVVYQIPFKPGEKQSFIYGNVVDSRGNAYALKIRDNDIDRFDAETGQRRRFTPPTKNAGPRRGDYDNQDRIWFSENNAMKVGMLDPRSGEIAEYKLPIPLGNAYTTNVDRKTGLVWTGEHFADRFAVLDPKTGEMRDYLLPTRDSQVRIISPASSGDHSIIWFGAMPKYESGKIVKMEVWW